MQSRDRVRWLAYRAQARLRAARLAPLVAEAMEFTDGLGRPVARPLQGQPEGDHLATAVLHPKCPGDEQRAGVLGAPWESLCARLEVHDARVGYLMRDALKPNQSPSEAIRGKQMQSEAIRCNQGARVGHLMREALRCHQDTINKQTDPLRWCARRSAGLPNGIVPRACSRPPKASRRAPSGRGA